MMSFLNKKILLKNTLLIITVFILMEMGFYVFPHAHDWLSQSAHIVEKHSIRLTVFRWSFIVLFFIFWPAFVQIKAKTEKWTATKKHYWLQKRFPMMMWLIIFEIVICENALGKILYHLV